MLDRKTSLAVAGGTAAIVYATFNAHVPPVCDAKATDSGDKIHASAVRSAAWSSAAIVTAVAVITKDATVFALGGAAVILLTWLHRHANLYDPLAGLAARPSSRSFRDDQLTTD